jgi:predicted phosphoribosyltransferase
MAEKRFRDRRDAGQALLLELARKLTEPPAVVAALAPGGVIVAEGIADHYGVPLTVLSARKLTTPLAPDLSFGAVDEDGHTVMSYDVVAGLRLSPEEMEPERVKVWAELRAIRARYPAPALSTFLPAPCVVLVDEGLATGLTMEAAVAYARRCGAAEIAVAAPCASATAAARFQGTVDKFVCLLVDEAFEAIGAYYQAFPPVSDAEVSTLLARRASAPSR